jgi:hypothetical protein
MIKPTGNTVESLKGHGAHFAAGALSAQLGHGRAYGCHYGTRSDLDASRDAFYAGYDAAIAASR